MAALLEKFMDRLDGLYTYPYRQKMTDLIYDTPIEVAIGFVMGAGFAATGAWMMGAKDDNMIPTAFSEISAIRRDFAKKGEAPPALTRYYAKLNDMDMKVFEARNIAQKTMSVDFDKTFAQELEFKIARELKVHTTIPEHAAELAAQDAPDALKAVEHIARAGFDLPALNESFRTSWSESHIDHNKTVHYTEEECTTTGSGENAKTTCVDVDKTREEYDYTTHSYTFHRAAADQSRRLLAEFITKHPDVAVHETLYTAKETGADNEYAIETSLKGLIKGKVITPKEAIDFANVWATGSNVSAYGGEIVANHAALRTLRGAWGAAVGTARSTSYDTGFRSDDGPQEFRLRGTMIAHASAMEGAITPLVGGMRKTLNDAPALVSMARECIAVALDREKGLDEDACDKTLKIAQASYTANFAKGYEVDKMHIHPVILWGLAGGVLGAMAGLGVDTLLNRRRRNHTLRNF